MEKDGFKASNSEVPKFQGKRNMIGGQTLENKGARAMRRTVRKTIFSL
jgi:hypothetical protein